MPTYEEVIKRDNALMNLATYDASEGLMIAPLETREEVVNLQTKVRERFNLWKRLIQMGELDYETIEQDVLTRNGPFYKGTEKLQDVDEMYTNAIEEAETREDNQKKIDDLTAQWSRAIYSTLMEAGLGSGNDDEIKRSYNYEVPDNDNTEENDKPDDDEEQ